MRWYLGRIVVKRRLDYLTEFQFDLFSIGIQISELWRKVKSFFDQEILDCILNGALSLDNEIFKITGIEWASEQNVESYRGNEMRFKYASNRRLTTLLNQFGQIRIWQTRFDNLPVGISSQWSAIKNGTA
jgi:hypothetical protein